MKRGNNKEFLYISEVFDTFKECGLELSKETKERILKSLRKEGHALVTWNDTFKSKWGTNSHARLWKIQFEDHWASRYHDGTSLGQTLHITAYTQPDIDDARFIRQLVTRPRKMAFGANDFDLTYSYNHEIKCKKHLAASIFQMSRIINERNGLMTSQTFSEGVKHYKENAKKIGELRKENNAFLSSYVGKISKKLALKREAENLH